MKSLSSSNQRDTFGLDRLLERRSQEGRTPENDPDTAAYVDYMLSSRRQKIELEQTPEWQENNLEYDLRTCDWILEKTRASESYAQNLYAAMCNNDFQRLDLIPILKEQLWSCSWRYAGGIIADMRQEGDYIDWYCSGIKDTFHEDDIKLFSEEQLARLEITKNFVGESVVTDEIRADLKKLGWLIKDTNV